jgi:uncharacterized membrane protein
MTVIKVSRIVVRAVLSALLIGMGINHFRPKQAHVMAKMIPPRMRRDGLLSPDNLVAFTGACEIAGGIGIQLPQTRRLAGGALVAFFIAIFPANAHASANPDTFKQLATPFWPRLGAQLVVMAAAVFAASGRSRALR